MTFNSEQDAQLFDVMYAVREINPRRADEILEQRPDLRVLLQQYPKRQLSMQADGASFSFMAGGSDQQSVSRASESGRSWLLTQALAQAALNTIRSDPDNAIAPEDRLATWHPIADAAHRLADQQLVWRTQDRVLSDAAEIYKKYALAEVPSIVLRDYWPSTLAYRRVVRRAAKILGIDAEPLLLKIANPDMNLLARIAMAQALLGRPHTDWTNRDPRLKP